MAVYEPPFRPDSGSATAATLRSRVEQLLEAGDRSAAVALHLRESGTPAHIVESMQQAPWWPRMESFAHTLPYDEAICGDLSIPVERLRLISVPTLVLAGADSDPEWLRALRLVSDAIAHGEYQTLEGQTHVPSDEALVPVLTTFFEAAT